MAAMGDTMAELDVAYIVDDGGYLNENDGARGRDAELGHPHSRQEADGAGQVKLRNLDMRTQKAAGFF